jgi:hypothetical protein
MDFTYRLALDEGRWVLSKFKEATLVPPVISYAEKTLPYWLTKKVSLLNLVGATENVIGVGYRLGPNVYWFNGDNNEKL